MTGRGMGYCAGFDAPGFMNPGFGRGSGRGPSPRKGGGRGWRHWFYATGLPGWARFGFGQPMSEEQEVKMLKEQAKALQRELDAINKRLEETRIEQ